jgi:hypothetical protein
MVCVNQTRLHCVNQMGKTQSKPLAERHDRETAWERHGMCESALRGCRFSCNVDERQFSKLNNTGCSDIVTLANSYYFFLELFLLAV